jgi:hypothetical protein
MDEDAYDPEFGLAYDPMLCPLAYYACFHCRELFAYPSDESPICGRCGYDGCNAALLVQAMDAEVQTDDLLVRHALPIEPAWKPITLTTCGSNFVAASPLPTESAQSGKSSRTGEGFSCPAGDACIQTIWEHTPECNICTDVYWWPGSSADRAVAPPGYSLAGRKKCPTRLPSRGSATVQVFPLDEIDALPPPPTAPLPRVRVPRGLRTHVKLCALLGCIAPAQASSIALPAPLLALSCKYPALIVSLLVILDQSSC